MTKEESHQNCPICNSSVEPSQRYPNYLCDDCVKKSVTKDGEHLEFFNKDFAGGYVAYSGSVAFRKNYDSHICFIDGVECYANEAYFGGIVVSPKIKILS